jgi:DNA-binding transcriptional LysR family regulator
MHVQRGDECAEHLIAHRYLPEDHPPSGENTNFRVLGNEPLLPVARASNTPLRLADCSDADWVAGSLRDVDRQLLLRWAGQAGFQPRVSHETRDYHTAVELIVSGLAVGLLPASVVSAPHNRGRLAMIEPERGLQLPSRDVLTITRAGFQTSAAVTLLDLMAEVLERITCATSA